ncbi:thioredoxin [Imleria badia]|nr:thioredoxin [Imleria badia]
MTVQEIKSFSEFQDLINSGKVIIIDFWASWCGPCRAISPVFEKISDDPAYVGAEFYKVNTDEQEQISEELGIRSLPTFQVYKDGNKIREQIGANPAGLQTLVQSGIALL